MKRRYLLTGFLLAFAPVGASAQVVAAGSEATASNGVVISVSDYDSGDRIEYHAPEFELTGPSNGQSGKFRFGTIKSDSFSPVLNIQGSVYYRTKAHDYDNAVFVGGEAVEFERVRTDSENCPANCLYSEFVVVSFSKAQAEKYSRNGVLTVQVRNRSRSNSFLLAVPVAHIAALNEVAGK